MPRQRGMGKRYLALIGLAAAGVFIAGMTYAGPIELPDSARPGAVRPEQEERAEVPQGPPAETMEIPAVIDRPFEVEECPCALIKQFRLLNAEDLPEFEISVAEVQAILDEKIKQQPAEGFSIGQLTEVANAARDYYRQKGLILAQVVIPVQTVQSGIVDLEVYVGKLGRVLAEGNEIYSSETLAKVFEDQIGQPINKADVEAALLRLTDYPGLTVFGVFQPGQLVGTADIVLKVQDEKRFDVAMRVDNEGTDDTGMNRFRTVIDWNNLTDGADRLTATIQQTYNPKLNVFKSVQYSRYLADSSYRFIANVDANKFDVGGAFASQNIHGETEVQKLTLEKSFIRSRIENFIARIDFARKESTTTTSFNPTNRDKLSVLTVGVDYDSVDTFSFSPEGGGGGINFGVLELSHGFNDIFGAMGTNADAQQLIGSGFEPSRQGGSDAFAAGQFSKLFASYTRLQTLFEGNNLLFRAEWQWSDDLLVPLEQYAVGGPENVRAFPPAQVLWDRAYFYSFEWLMSAPFIADQIAFENRRWGELLQLTAFYDFAVGRLNNPRQIDQQGYDRLDGWGIGLRFNVPGSIDSRLFWAWEIGHDEIANEDRPQIWGDFTYSF